MNFCLLSLLHTQVYVLAAQDQQPWQHVLVLPVLHRCSMDVPEQPVGGFLAEEMVRDDIVSLGCINPGILGMCTGHPKLGMYTGHVHVYAILHCETTQHVHP